MADKESNSGLSEVMEKGSGAASAVKGAIKTGKALAGAAKGAAAGPYGAAAGAIWQNRKLLAKVLISALVVLMLPILFILLLPALIFGGLDTDDPDAPILNDSSSITAHIEDIRTRLDGVIRDGLAGTLTAIDNDYASSGAQHKEVVNPYDGGTGTDALLILSQYSAGRAEDFSSISPTDFESTIRAHQASLFTFTKVTEQRSNEDNSATETVAVYTVVYQGDTYFADSVFRLTPEQKTLAIDYYDNLRLYLTT